MNPWFVSIPIAYLLGSIPFGYLLVRMFRKEDIRTIGSGNIGATNVVRSGAKGLGIATLALDLGKALAAVLIAKHLAPGNYDVQIAAAVAAILGHMFPVWLRFQGGKGVASALGVMIGLAPWGAVGILSVFLIAVILTRYVSLGSVLGAGTFPLFGLYFAPEHTPFAIAGFVLIAFLVIAKHHQNIQRLLKGTESRFGSGKATA
jgi:glycerol-3-phosphate acyltransferase PlsY